jgi:hypothetical protein
MMRLVVLFYLMITLRNRMHIKELIVPCFLFVYVYFPTVARQQVVFVCVSLCTSLSLPLLFGLCYIRGKKAIRSSQNFLLQD